MIDRIFTAALAFCLLAGGTLAVGSALFGTSPQAAVPAARSVVDVVQLPTVQMTGKRVDSGTAWARTEGTEPAIRKVQ